MRLRNIPGAREEMLVNPFVVQEPEKKKGHWNGEVFPNSRPLHVEIGTGKGRFICELASRNPQINYVGIEKFSSVLLRALQKREEMEADNLEFLRFDAEAVCEVFAPGEVDRIYLNFSDPWPKDRHWKRRLTSTEFLKRYEKILKPGGLIEFKTDNRGLFDFSVKSAEEAGWTVVALTENLYKSDMLEGNVQTEYEERFTLLGNPIMKMIIRKDAGYAASPEEAMPAPLS